MMNIDKLIREIIPPNDYQHRNGFNNVPILNQLTADEKLQIEDILIKMLLSASEQEIDTLIVETLAYLGSNKSVPILNILLGSCSDEITKLVISTSIFEINDDENMIETAINITRNIDDKSDAYYIYKLTSAFYYLIKFKSKRVNSFIEEYTKHKEYLVSYNAKQVLNQK